MHKVGTQLDRWAAVAIRVLYFVGAFFSIVGFFSQQAYDSPAFNFFMNFALGGAFVAHEVLQSKRVALLRKRVLRAAPDELPKVKAAFKSDLYIFLGLSFFSFVALWTHFYSVAHHTTPIPLDVYLPIQAAVLVGLSFAATLLMDSEDDAVEILHRAESEMLFSTIKRSTKQWKKRLAAAVRNRHNLAPITMSLMEDVGNADGARRIRLIEEGLAQTEGVEWSKQGNLYLPAAGKKSGATGKTFDYQNGLYIPTGSASPIQTATEMSELAQSSSRKPTGNGSPKGGRMPRRIIKMKPMDKAVQFVRNNPTASLSDIQTGAKVSKDTAIKARNIVRSELGLSTGTEG